MQFYEYIYIFLLRVILINFKYFFFTYNYLAFKNEFLNIILIYLRFILNIEIKLSIIHTNICVVNMFFLFLYHKALLTFIFLIQPSTENC